MINGGVIVARAACKPPGMGFRQGSIIMVAKPVRATSMAFVTARHYGADKSWDGGNYFDEAEDAVEDFCRRLKRSWGISEKT